MSNPRPRRRIDWVFSLGSLTVAIVSVVGLLVLRNFQVARNIAALHEEARRLETEGELVQALDNLTLYLNQRPNDRAAWIDLARLYDKSDPEGRRASEVFLAHKEALQRNPDDRALRERAIELAFEIGRPQDVFTLLEPLLGADPNDLRLKLLEARCLAGQEDHKAAAAILEAVLEADPTHLDAYVGLAELLRGPLRRPDDASALLDRMVEANPELPAARLRRWRVLRSRPETRSKADTREVALALEKAPGDLDALRAAAEVALEEGRLVDGRTHLDAAHRINPNDAALAATRAALELRDDRPDTAIAILRDAIRADPRNLDLPLSLVDLLIDQREIDGSDGARALLVDLRRRGLNPSIAEFLDGRISALDGHWGDSLRRFTAARDELQRDPTYAQRIDRAILECQNRLGLQNERLATLERMARRDDADIPTRLALAEAFVREGRLDQAASIYRLLVSVRPESRLDLIGLAVATQLRKSPSERRWEQVESLLAEAQAGLPPSPALVLRRAATLATLGRNDQSRAALEDGLARFPDSPPIRAALARSLASDHPDRARAVLDAAPDPGSPQLALTRLAIDLDAGDVPAEEAIARLEHRLDSSPDDDKSQLLEGLVRARLRLGDLDGARDTLTRLLTLQGSVGLRLLLLDVLIQLDDLETAQAQIAAIRALEGDSGIGWRHAQARIDLDRARRGERDATERVRAVARAIAERKPDSWIAPMLLGRLAEIAGQFTDAIEQYRRALRLGAEGTETARRLIGLLYREQQFDEIDALVRELSTRDAATGDLLLLTALNALRKDQTDAGLAQAREILTPASRDPLDLLMLGRMLVFSGRAAEAEAPLRRAVELGPTLPETHLNLIEWLVSQDRRDDARKQLEALFAIPPESRTLAEARACDLLGDVDRAAVLFDQAVGARPSDPATLRAAAESALRNRRDDRARELLNTLVAPKTNAPTRTVAWARRSLGFLGVRGGSLEQIDQALQTVEANLRSNPYNFDDQRARALLLAMRPSRRDEAIRALQSLEESRLLSAEERFLLAMLHGSNHDLERCNEQMKRLLASPQRTPAHLAYMVILQLDRQKPDEARRWLAELERAEPDSLRSLEMACRLLSRDGKRDAIRRRLLDHAAARPTDLLAVAGLFERHEFPDEAEQLLRSFDAREPRQPGRTLVLLEFLGRRGRTAEALDLAASLRDKLPAGQLLSVAVPIVLIHTATDADRLRVESWLDTALAAAPRDPALRLKQANMRLFQGRGDEARSIYSEILANAPDDLEALNNLAWQLAFQDGQGAEALRLIERAIENYGPVPALLDTRAIIRVRRRETEPALRDLGDALSAQPLMPLLHFHLAWAHHAANNLDDARQALRRAQDLGLTAEATDPLERPTYLELLSELSVD